MKIKFSGVLIVVLSLLLFSVKRQEQTVVVYSSQEQFRNDELVLQLEKKFPHIDVQVMYIPTGKSAAKIILEGDKSEADIVLGLETSYLKKISNNLEDISGISRISYLEEFKPAKNNNNYVVWERQAGAFVVNTEVLSKYNLEAPKTYEDLLNKEYRNLIAMPDPKSSGTGYFFLKNRINTLGDEGGFSYFKDLEPNIKQFTESGSGPIKLLNQGEIAIGLALTFQGASEKNIGRPFEIIFPPEGSPYSLTGTGLLKGRKTNNDIMRIFDFIINDFIKFDKENFSPEQIYEGQVNLIENYPKDVKYGDMSGIESIDEKERLLEQWKY